MSRNKIHPIAQLLINKGMSIEKAIENVDQCRADIHEIEDGEKGGSISNTILEWTGLKPTRKIYLSIKEEK